MSEGAARPARGGDAGASQASRQRDAAYDRAHWEARHAEGDWRMPPSRWVLEQCLALPEEWTMVELAAGSGRHARALAGRGRKVVAVDFIERAVATAAAAAGVLGVVADSWALPFRERSLDAVLVVSYLERDLMPAFTRLLRPGGRLVYETFMASHAARVRRGEAKGPKNPTFLLQPGELRRLVAPLRVLAYREGAVEDDAGARDVAGVVAEAAAG